MPDVFPFELLPGFPQRFDPFRFKRRRADVFQHFGYQMGFNLGARCNHGHTLDDVAQFAHITGPVVGAQNRPHRRRKRFFRPAFPVTDFLQEKFRQRLNVLRPLAQRGEVDLNDVDAVIQVFSETPFFDEGRQVLVRGANDPNIDVVRFGAAHRKDGLIVHGAQQLGLHGHIHVADFIQKQRTLISRHELARIIAHRAGEAPFHMAEQLAFDECVGNGGAVHRHERMRGAFAVQVNGASHQLLTGAAFSGDQHFTVHARRPVDERINLLHSRAVADHSVAVARFLQ